MKIGLSTKAFSRDFAGLFNDIIELNGLDILFVDNVDLSKDNDIDVLVLSGGEDISPSIYNEVNTASYSNPRRDTVDLSNTYSALAKGIKIFGVCRGHQLINAVLGGKLLQHIPVGHPHTHNLTFSNDFPYQFPFVNSMHHQGVLTLGKDMVSKAVYNDVHEITESKDGKILSVQFHPEFMFPINLKILKMISDFLTR